MWRENVTKPRHSQSLEDIDTKMLCFTIYAIHAINAKIVVKWCKHFTKMISYALYTFFYSYKSFFMK